MLVAVIMIFVVMSFTGVAVLDVSYNSRTASMATIENIKVQYMLESSVNETLWRINTGVDSLVNTDIDGITTSYNADTGLLTVSLDTLNTEAEITMDLTEDTHFNRGIASENAIPSDIADAGITKDNQGRKFNSFLTLIWITSPTTQLRFMLKAGTHSRILLSMTVSISLPAPGSISKISP